jgi:acetyl-CoA acetyltransferase
MVQGTPKLLGRRNTVGLPAESLTARFDAEDVLSSPLVVDPLRLLEIVMPTGGAAGVLVTTTERAAALRHAPVPGAKRA